MTAEIAMNVKRISEKIGNSETNADNLLNAMRTVQHSSQQIETLTNKVGVIERQIKDSGLGISLLKMLQILAVTECCYFCPSQSMIKLQSSKPR